MSFHVIMLWFNLAMSAITAVITLHFAIIEQSKVGVLLGSIEAVSFGVFTLIARHRIIQDIKEKGGIR